MKKTKLAVIGATITISIVLGLGVVEYHQIDDKIQSLTQQYQQIKQDKVKLQEELNKSNEEVKNQSKTIQEKQKQLEETTNKLKELDRILNDLSTDISFNAGDLTEPSNASLAQVRKALNGTPLAGLEEAFFKAERVYKVNAMFLIGLVANESSWGTSRRAVEQNNMTGFEVYTDNSEGAMFATKEESVLTTARILATTYLDPKGQYHNGYSLWAVNIKYSQINGQPNYSWSDVINSITNDLVAKVNN